MGNTVLLKIVVQGLQIQPYLLGNEVQGGTGHQCAPQVSHKSVKAKAGIGCKLALGRYARTPGVVLGEQAHIAVVEHAALGRAGGAAGIQQHKEVFGFGVGLGLAFGKAGNVCSGQNRPLKSFNQFRQAFIGNEHGAGCVLHHELQSLLGIGRIQRLIGAAGLEHAHGGNHGVFAPAQDDGNHMAGLHGLFNMGGQLVGKDIHFLVSQLFVCTDKGGLVGSFFHALLPEVQHRLFGVSHGLSRIEAIQRLDLGGRCKLQLPHRIGLLERQDGGGQALCEVLEDALRVLAGPIPEAHLVGAFCGGEEFHREVETRRIGTQVFSEDPFSGQDKGGHFRSKLALETKIDARPQAQVRSAVCHGEERTGPQAHRLRLHMVQNLADGRFRCGVHKGGQGMHAHRESCFGRHALPAVPDGGEAGGEVCVPRSQRKAEQGGKQDAVGVPVAFQDLPHGNAVYGQLHQQ